MSNIIVEKKNLRITSKAIKAAENGAKVTLLEKMKKPGRKMMITGKGRCNITNAADVPEIIKNICGNGAFRT